MSDEAETAAAELPPFAQLAPLPAPPLPPPACKVCGVRPPADQPFPGEVCELCETSTHHRDALKLLAILLMSSAITMLACTLASPSGGLWFWANIMMIPFLQIASIVPHELGHMLGAWLMRGRIFALTLGLGREIFAFEIHGVEVRVKAVPLGGSVMAVLRTPRWERARNAVIIALGPLATVLVIVLALGVIPAPQRWSASAWMYAPAPWHALALANALMLATNLLFPIRSPQTGEPTSDGWKLLRLARGDRMRDPRKDQSTVAVILEADRLHRRGKFEAAAEFLERARVELPERDELVAMLAVVRLAQRRYQDGVELLRPLVNAMPPPATQTDRLIRGARLNNLAWAELMTATTENLPHADHHSAEAFALTPNTAATRSTRGSTLVEKGDYAEGLVLLRSAMSAAEMNDQKACVACFIAIGEFRRGKPEVAADMLRTARRLDPNCELLHRAKRSWAIRDWSWRRRRHHRRRRSRRPARSKSAPAALRRP